MTYQKYKARTVSSIYFVYLYLVFKFRVSCNIFIFTFLVVIQLSVLSVVLLVVKSCEPSKTVSVFYLLSCLLFCVTSRMNQVLFQNKVGLIDEWLLKYPGILIAFVYLCSVLKYIALLTQLQTN
ncbi:Hypothetical_protein [Hexamita inflata]|uniref:Hypothetical_protein n=1 Tax=Hexamita inflata TaxID=28002 RepID=A0AA86R8V7_9EUKA|nr:Hypothetical protein HINF_LOCUS61221 [Hexamita inflata]